MHGFRRSILGSTFLMTTFFLVIGCGTSEESDTTPTSGGASTAKPVDPAPDHSQITPETSAQSPLPESTGHTPLVSSNLEEPTNPEPVTEAELPLFIVPENAPENALPQPTDSETRNSVDADPNLDSRISRTRTPDRPMRIDSSVDAESAAEIPMIAIRPPKPVAMESLEVNPSIDEEPMIAIRPPKPAAMESLEVNPSIDEEPFAVDVEDPMSESRLRPNQPAMVPPEFADEEAIPMTTKPWDENESESEPFNAIMTAKSSSGADPEPTDLGYQQVTVYYGTDRKAITDFTPNRKPYIAWMFRTAFLGAITLVCLGIAIWRRNHRISWSMVGTGATATFALAIVALATWFQTDPSLASPERMYGNERGVLEMGTCEVTIPNSHEIAVVERPSVFRFEFTEDPTKHVVLIGVERQEADAFYGLMRKQVDDSRQKEAFVFVHGYNVTFDAAARRTAQLAHDLKFDGVPIFFSWPSQGGLLQYTVDETNAIWTVPQLKQFLTGIAQHSGARSIHLIAHSMGNRALTSTLQSLAIDSKNEKPLFREVILTAPDIDADIFRRDIAPSIVKTAERVTLYASSNDKALALSKQVHGYPRAGDSGDHLIIVPGIDTIDVSRIDTSLVAHSYYGSNQTVLADLLDIIHDRKPPAERPFLQPMQMNEMPYWVFLTSNSSLTKTAQPPSTSTRR